MHSFRKRNKQAIDLTGIINRSNGLNKSNLSLISLMTQELNS